MILRFMLAAALATTLLVSPGKLKAEQESASTGMRGKRYCEVLLQSSLFSPWRLSVYNTAGLNDCFDDLWQKLDPKAIAQSNNVYRAILNGPRYWLFDDIRGKLLDQEKVEFGGIAMRKAGEIRPSILDLMSLGRPYYVHPVHRDVTWTYHAGLPIFELIDPAGRVYVMQSMSTQVHPQTLETLPGLAAELVLPAGWHYKSAVLSEPLVLASKDQTAHVLQDDFRNSYSLWKEPAR